MTHQVIDGNEPPPWVSEVLAPVVRAAQLVVAQDVARASNPPELVLRPLRIGGVLVGVPYLGGRSSYAFLMSRVAAFFEIPRMV